jgi:hypothetical protein
VAELISLFAVDNPIVLFGLSPVVYLAGAAPSNMKGLECLGPMAYKWPRLGGVRAKYGTKLSQLPLQLTDEPNCPGYRSSSVLFEAS